MSLVVALLLTAVISDGGVFFVPYHLLGEASLITLITPSVFLAPVLAICFAVWLVRFSKRPVSACVCVVVVSFGVLHLVTTGFSTEFYNLVRILAPASFVLGLTSFAEIAIRKTPNHFPTACFAFALSTVYWVFTVGLTSVVG